MRWDQDGGEFGLGDLAAVRDWLERA